MFHNLKISLKLKIALLFSLLVIVMMLIVTYIFTIRELNLRVGQVKLRMERLAQNIASIISVEAGDWEIYQTYINNQLRLNPDIVYIAIFDKENNLKASALNTDWIELDLQRTMSRLEQIDIVLRLDQRQIANESQRDLESKSVNIIIGDQKLGTVKVGFSLVDLNNEMRSNLYRNLELALVFLILVINASMYISHKIVTPLSKLTKSMQQISAGDLNQQVRIHSHDEIGEMAKTFNFMTKGLREKESIEKFSRELGFTVGFDKIARLITERLTVSLAGDKGLLLLREKNETAEFELASSYPQPLADQFHFSREKSVCQYFLSRRAPIELIELIAINPRFAEFVTIFKLENNAVVTPIVINEEVIGIFILSRSKSDRCFSDEEKDFLNTMMGQAGLAIENALLLNELTEQERLKRELEIARQVQLSLLPHANPRIDGLDIAGLCIPATEIGGDYFDFFPLDSSHLGIAIADVTGKGTSAAFYMAVVKGIMLSLTPIFFSPKKLLCELNRRLFGTMDRKVFVTMIYGVFNMEEKRLLFARAGHNTLIFNKRDVANTFSYSPAGLGLGLEEGKLFARQISEQEIFYEVGDSFLFYTDGITEAMNDKRDEFSEERLIEIFSKISPPKSASIRENIIDEINRFVAGAPQHDDITFVSVTAT